MLHAEPLGQQSQSPGFHRKQSATQISLTGDQVSAAYFSYETQGSVPSLVGLCAKGTGISVGY